MKKNKPGFYLKKFTNIFLLVLLTGVIIYALFLYNEIQMQIEMREDARNIFVEAQVSPPPTPMPTPVPTSEPTPDPEPTPIPEPTEKRIRQPYLALRERYNNEDIIGFLDIPGTSIYYPVVQTDNNDFYLNHNIEKGEDSAGWVFMDYENDVAKEDENTIIYGHNMNADIMFHSLRNYLDKDFLDSHKYVTFNTIYDDYKWEIFSVYISGRDFYYIQVDFRGKEFEKLLGEMKSRSIFDTGVEVTPEDRILTLSTCSNLPDESLLVINAKLVDNRQSEE